MGLQTAVCYGFRWSEYEEVECGVDGRQLPGYQCVSGEHVIHGKRPNLDRP
jgi:hypothetical protein